MKTVFIKCKLNESTHTLLPNVVGSKTMPIKETPLSDLLPNIDTDIDPLSIIKKYGLESESLIGGQQVLALMYEYGETILQQLNEKG